MAVRSKRIVLTLSAVGMVVVGLGLVAGLTVGSSTGQFPSSGMLKAGSGSGVSAGTFNFSKNGPVWDTGNLCVVQVSGSYLTCSYSGSYYHHYGQSLGESGKRMCHCSYSTSLIYNFSISHETLNISLSNISQKMHIYVNIEGNHTTININVTGCSRGGGSLNVSVLGEYNKVNFVNSASGISSSFAIYENHNPYAAWISGNWDKTKTVFARANPKLNQCPRGNGSTADTWSATLTGFGDVQKLVWASGIGYSSPPNWVSVGYFDGLVFENSSTFSCYWSFPLPSSCHGNGEGYSPAELATIRK